MIFKKETISEEQMDNLKDEKEDLIEKKKNINYEDKLSIVSTYKLMWKIIWIPPVKQLIVILLTFKVRFYFTKNFNLKNNILLTRLALLLNQ